jgi:hypothetical protein
VSKQTGHPPDLLDIDLEADLGIDTVKEADVFAASATPSSLKATTRSSWATTRHGKMGLPTHVDRVTRFAGAGYPGPRWAVVAPRDGGADAEVLDESGCVRLGGYGTIDLRGGLYASAVEPIRSAMSGS